ncbi:MAG TPA: aminomethyl-transferring glycine dehydrogenase subunit GcvPA [Alphaproteobacteria bacterium]|nr:aminomethyl-transferring glycine dehydrogenase subunit GcvPA [Alphaproteobacteria bacterium]USO04971.1 MAG: aminomethyl-transferring glycine dehydrogenase subunit GcvPA [Rhodospirillales bacterium]HOO82214.1 aminomethyl-transferring glycine dehydrogenase subunit GcvPA [Alphaproteobacteria bacterium]
MRYLPQTQNARAAMLKTIGVGSIDDLYVDVPATEMGHKFNLPDHQGELDVERHLNAYANQNHAASAGPFFLGAGAYYHHIPASVDYIIQRSEFLTAYTPYQPEIAQGTLQAIFEFQTFIAQLTGQDVANASMYDGATATTEAALMALRVTKRKKIVIGNALHPDYRGVLKSYMWNLDGDVKITDGAPDEQTACVIIQSPDFYGAPHKYDALRKSCDETGALLIVVVTEIVSLGLLPAPAEADIVCGEAQSIGIPLSYGGPYLGFFACKEKYLRQMPGRLCGMTEDADGKRGFVLTLSTREQHIRRDKATSNICTNQGLCALAFTVHMSLLGEDGFKRLARLNHEAACRTADALTQIPGVKLLTENFFNEFTLELPRASKGIVKALAGQGIIAGYDLDENQLLIAATEMTTDEDIAALTTAMKEALA